MTGSTIFAARGALLAGVMAMGLAACGDNTGGTPQTQTPTADDHGVDHGPVPEGRVAAPEGALVYFANLSDGDTVTNPVTIEFGSENIVVVEAGDQTAGTGHHHLLVNVTLDDLDLEWPIPTDDQHLHYGLAQTEATIELPTGTHTLQLVMGDWTHIPHHPPVASEVITITVE